MFPENSGYKYSNTRLFLAKKGDMMDYIKGNSGLQERDCYLECDDLESGTYQLFCEVDWLSSSPESDFVVSCYGVDSCNFSDLTKSHKVEDVIKNVMKGMVEDSKNG